MSVSTQTIPLSSKPRDIPVLALMRFVRTFLPLLSLLDVAVQHVAASYGASILYPNASSVWYRDYMHNVTWCVFW